MHEQAQLAAAARNARRSVARLAREDCAVFCQFVLRDERTGKRIRLAPMHREWHEKLDSSPRFVLWAHVDSGKTQQIAVGRTLWLLGKNPNRRCVIITKTQELAKKIVRTCKEYLERSVDLREVFPHLQPSKDPSMPWSSTMLTVQRSVVAKEASIQATNLFGNITGSRFEWVVFDDILDDLNTRTPTPRAAAWDWIRSTVFGRLSGDDAVAALGNAWHPEDTLHQMEKEPRFVAARYPVRGSDGKLTWPEHWTEKRVENARQDMGALEFQRALMCQARDDEASRFKREWLEACCARGEGLDLFANREDFFAAARAGKIPGLEVPDDEWDAHEKAVAALALGGDKAAKHFPDPLARVGFFTGVDLAVQQHASADLTALFSIAVLPNGDRVVLAVESGRWTAPEILRRIVDHHVRYGSQCVVENVAAQQYIVQMLQAETSIPVVGFTTGKNKADPSFGFEALAAEFEAKKWIIPSGKGGKHRSKEVDAWIVELVNYEPPPKHTGDRAMAAWFAREGARPFENRRLTSSSVRVFG